MSDDNNDDAPVVISEEQIERLIARIGGGDQRRTILHLMDENNGYRKQRRALKKEIDELRGKLPGDKDVVLSGDSVDLWTKYQALGKPEELEETKSKVSDLQGEIRKRDEQALINEAAGVLSYKSSVLVDLVQSKGLAIEMRDITVDGQVVRTPYGKFKSDEKSEMKPLTDIVSSSLADYVPALTADVETGGTGTVTFPNQRPSDRTYKPSKESAKVAARVNSQYKSPGQMRKDQS